MAIRVQLQPGYVLHRRPYLESSLLLEVLSRDHGRVPLVGRGARRAKSSGRSLLQPFVPLLLSWTARGDLGTLTGYEAGSLTAIPTGRAIYSGFYVNELVLRVLFRHDPHPELYSSYERMLVALTEQPASQERVEAALRLFEKRVLDAVGYGLVFFDEFGEHIDFEPKQPYLYRREIGPRPALTGVQNGPDGVVVSGQTLLVLQQERRLVGTHLVEAKRLMRYLLRPLIGERPLASRDLFTAGRG